MEPFAVISDIHSNPEALDAVLSDIRSRGIRIILNAGDMVGYGPDPLVVVERVRSEGIQSVMGNHEWGLLDARRRNWFNTRSRKALNITQKLLPDKKIAAFADLPTSLIYQGCRVVHGCPPDSVTAYLFAQEESKLKRMLLQSDTEIVFVGHTHLLAVVRLENSELIYDESPPPIVHLPQGNAIVNVGSVGQPRDGSREAKYVIWNPKDRVLEFRRVSYPVQPVVDRILERGMPSMYADRLWGR